MRTVKSRSFFEQMKGRGVRVIGDDDLKAVTSDAKAKDHFVIVDAVGVCEQDKTDSRPMDRKKTVSFEKLLQAISLGNTETDVISSVAVRLARLNNRLSDKDRDKVIQTAKGKSLQALTTDLVNSLDPDRHLETAKSIPPQSDPPTDPQIEAAKGQLIQAAVKPLYDPDLRDLLVELQKKTEQTIDHISQDQVISAGFDADALEKAKGVVDSFEAFIEANKDEITALQILYNRPYKAQLGAEELQALADAIHKPPHHLSEDRLWQAYAAIEKDKVRGVGAKHILTDLVSLVRFALHQDNELVPFAERVDANFKAWLAQQANAGREFTLDQVRWLKMIRDHIAGNHSMGTEDFEYSPFIQNGGLGGFYEMFGDQYAEILEALNSSLVA